MALPDVEIEPSKATTYFTPAQCPAAGTAANPQTSGNAIPKLYTPLKVRGVTFQNRLGVCPPSPLIFRQGNSDTVPASEVKRSIY
jgi:hypothetical protein